MGSNPGFTFPGCETNGKFLNLSEHVSLPGKWGPSSLGRIVNMRINADIRYQWKWRTPRKRTIVIAVQT